MRLAAIIIVSLLVLGTGTYGLLVLTGAIKFGAKPAAVQAKIRPLQPGEVWVPMNSRELTAGTMVTLQMLLNPKTQQPVREAYRIQAIEGKGIMTAVSDIQGRVLRHNLHPGYMFAESDFFPKHTREGVTSFIPMGKVSVTFLASKLLGSRTLRAGDHVDLLGARKVDVDKIKGPPSQLTKFHVAASYVQPLASDAVVVTPVTVIMVTKGGTDKKPKRVPVEEIDIAVDPKEAPAVFGAIDASAEIMCLAHSGLPGGTTQPIVVEAPPEPPPDTTVKLYVGKNSHDKIFSFAETQPAIQPNPAPAVGSPASIMTPAVDPTPEPKTQLRPVAPSVTSPSTSATKTTITIPDHIGEDQ